MTKLWRNWLLVWCGITLAFGIVLAISVVPAADGAARFAFTMLGGFRADAAPLDVPAMRFATALLGAVTIGWALTIMAVVRAAEGAALWRPVTVALLVWYVIDSAVSVACGYGPNAVSNTLFLTGFLVPVLASGVLQMRTRMARA